MADDALQNRKFKTVFSLIDKDKNNVIGWNDVLRITEGLRKELGWMKDAPRFVTLVQELKNGWDKVLQLLGLDQNGSISYAQCLGLFARFGADWAVNGALPPWAFDICYRLQRALDVNGDGTYTQNEYALYLRALGSDADPKSVFAKLDANKDGRLTLSEIMELGKQFATSNDPAAPGNYLVAGKF